MYSTLSPVFTISGSFVCSFSTVHTPLFSFANCSGVVCGTLSYVLSFIFVINFLSAKSNVFSFGILGVIIGILYSASFSPISTTGCSTLGALFTDQYVSVFSCVKVFTLNFKPDEYSAVLTDI